MSAPSRLHVLGIRHHGPGSARAVVDALDQLQPAAVAVELPADTADLLAWIGDPELVPPVAILGVAANDRDRACFLPFAEFSPEWQAVLWARRHGRVVTPIDLPLSAMLATSERQRAPVEHDDPIAVLAAAAGVDDPEQWWEDVVEHRSGGLATFQAVAQAMRALRTGAASSEFEARREAAMRGALRTLLAATDGALAVVCGAWHVPVLEQPWPSASADDRAGRGPKCSVSISWVPWSEPRLAARGGYGAGVVSPAWYAHTFAHPGPASAQRWLVDAARLLRSRGTQTSPDHLIGAQRAATALAALRGRPAVGLAELLDASEAVLADQGGMALLGDELVVGRRVGAVPVDAPQVPLAADVSAQQRRWRLKAATTPTLLELDLRQPTGRGRSVMLHRLAALEVPWGSPTEGRGSSGTFRETWELHWMPEMAVRLVEASVYGTTLATAAAARLVEGAGAARTPAELVAQLRLAVAGDLPEAVGPCVLALERLCAVDADVVDLIDALAELATTVRYGDVRGSDLASLRATFDALVARVLIGAFGACRSLDDDAAAAMVERLQAVQAALATVDHPERRAAWPALLARLADADGSRGQPTVHGLLRGRATRLLHDGEVWDQTVVRGQLSRALSIGTPALTGAAFVEGFLAGSGTTLIHDRALLGVVDEWLCSLSGDDFAVVVALLRRTFGSFDPGERRHLGVLIGAGEIPLATALAELDAARLDAVLDTVCALVGVDRGGE